MGNISRKALFLSKTFSALESSIDRFDGPEHDRLLNLLYGREKGKKLHNVNRIIDRGAKKFSKSHRKYGHNRKFIFKKFASDDEKICAAHLHLLGDFFQDMLRIIIVNVGEEFKKGILEGPFYEQFEDGKWGWDIKKIAIEKLIKESSEAFRQALKRKNRIGGLHHE